MKKKDKKKQMVLSFTGFLAGATVFSMMMLRRGFSATESRYLRKRPVFTVEGLLDGSYGRGYETSLSDQFPAWDVWIGVKVTAERAQGRKDVSGVYFGKDDYLIEKFGTEEIEGEQLDKDLSWMSAFAEKAEKRLGKDRVRIMLVPTASQILRDKLPLLAAPYEQSLVAERLAEMMGEDGQSLLVPVEEMLAAHEQEDIYYRTDYHWIFLSVYYGYRAWAESVGITPQEQDAFSIQTASEEFLGTISSKVNLPHKPDSINLYLPKAEPAYEVFYDGAPGPTPMYSYKALERKDKYAVYLDGNHGLTEVRNPGATEQEGEERKLLVIKDSFAHSFAPFAASHFGETFAIDLRYFNQSPQIFMEEHGITDMLVLYQTPGFSQEKTVSKLIRQKVYPINAFLRRRRRKTSSLSYRMLHW